MEQLDNTLEALHSKLDAKREELRSKYGGNAPPQEESVACRTCRGAEHLVTARIDPVAGRTESDLVPCPDCSESRIVAQRSQKVRIASGLEGKESTTFERFPPKSGQEGYWSDAQEYASSPHGWLVLAGQPYLGKTTLAVCIANDWLEAGKMVLFRNTPDLLDELRHGYGDDGGASYNDILRLLLDVPCLILDDYGRHRDTPWAQEKLFQITDRRLEASLPTVVTTNTGMSELRVTNERLYHRLADSTRCTVLSFMNAPISR